MSCINRQDWQIHVWRIIILNWNFNAMFCGGHSIIPMKAFASRVGQTAFDPSGSC